MANQYEPLTVRSKPCSRQGCLNQVPVTSRRELERRKFCSNACRIAVLHPRRQTCPNKWRHFRYGLSATEYDALRAINNGVCPLCLKKQAYDVDHDHQSRLIRGLLCRRCNQALGLLGDDIQAVERVLAYLRDGTASVTRLLGRAPHMPDVLRKQRPRRKSGSSLREATP